MRKCPHQIACRQLCRAISRLIIDADAQPIGDGDSPGKVVLDCIIKKTEGTIENSYLAVFFHSLHSSSRHQVPAFSVCLDFLQQWTVMQTCKPENTFSPKVALLLVFIIAIEGPVTQQPTLFSMSQCF